MYLKKNYKSLIILGEEIKELQEGFLKDDLHIYFFVLALIFTYTCTNIEQTDAVNYINKAKTSLSESNALYGVLMLLEAKLKLKGNRIYDAIRSVEHAKRVFYETYCFGRINLIRILEIEIKIRTYEYEEAKKYLKRIEQSNCLNQFYKRMISKMHLRLAIHQNNISYLEEYGNIDERLYAYVYKDEYHKIHSLLNETKEKSQLSIYLGKLSRDCNEKELMELLKSNIYVCDYIIYGVRYMHTLSDISKKR